MTFSAYLFDFDGTLVDSMPSFSGTMLRILNENNIKYENDIVKISSCNGVGKNNFFYITTDDIKGNTSLENDLTFKISVIEEDAIYVENASLLSSTGYYGVTKYYILRTDFSVENQVESTENENYFHYRATRNYIVTGIVYQLQRDYSREIAFTLSKSEEEQEVTSWSNGSFTLYQGEVKTSSIEIGNTVDVANISEYMKYSLDLEKDSNVTLTMGQATITSEGGITLVKDFEEDQYIKVVIKMGVSGADRQIGGTDTTYLILDTLNLALTRS